MTPKIDVEGLTIAVSSSRDTPEDPSKPKPRGKTKGKPDTRELISDAHLRLKAGVHYGLIGRNGTGKSSKHCFRIYHAKEKSNDIKVCDVVRLIYVTCSALTSYGRQTRPWNSTFDTDSYLATDRDRVGRGRQGLCRRGSRKQTQDSPSICFEQ